jgi:hypothetical protein
MPSPYRQPGEREGDRIIYFDYAKSLESRKRPIPWKQLGTSCLALLCQSAVFGIALACGPPQFAAARFLCPLTALICTVGLISLIRSNRALSTENYTEVKRGRPRSRDAG